MEQSTLFTMSCPCSLLTMTAITVDRLLAIRLKLRYRETVTLRRVTIALAFSYLLSALVASSYLWNNNLYLHATYSAVLICALVSSVCCLLVYITIHKHRRIQVCSHEQLRKLESNRKEASFNMVSYRSFFTTLYMYGSFSVCYLPYVCLKIAGRVTGWDQALLAAFYWSGTLVLINSSLNPLLFCWRIQGIRHAAKNIVQVLFPCLKLETRIDHPRPRLFQPELSFLVAKSLVGMGFHEFYGFTYLFIFKSFYSVFFFLLRKAGCTFLHGVICTECKAPEVIVYPMLPAHGPFWGKN